MPMVTSTSRQIPEKSFLFAMIFSGLVALGQMGAIGYALVQHKHIKSAVAPSSASEKPVETPPATTLTPPAEAVQATPIPQPLPLPTPNAGSRMSVESRVAALVAQARDLRQRGDTNATLIKLREAQTIAGEHPVVIAEMALTYEMMGLTDKALEQWRRLSGIGEMGGALTYLANLKLDPTFAINQNTTSTTTSIETPDALLSDSEGLQPGSVLGLMEIQTNEIQDSGAEKSLSLKIGVKARQGVPIEVRDVVIQVLFYDIINNEHIVQTNATVNSHWITPPADWQDEHHIEILEVNYLQPKAVKNDTPSEQNSFADALPEDGTRTYYGYIVRVYYKNKLEDVRAEPVSLLSLFPSIPEIPQQQ